MNVYEYTVKITVTGYDANDAINRLDNELDNMRSDSNDIHDYYIDPICIQMNLDLE